MVALSSTTSTRRPLSRSWSVASASTIAGRTQGSGSSNQNVLPAPSSLSTPISPPIDLDQPSADGQPEAGAAEAAGGRGVGLGERLEQPARSLGGDADAGVDDLEAQRDARRAVGRERADADRRPRPSAVNFTALPARLSRTWRIRPGRRDSVAGTSGVAVGDAARGPWRRRAAASSVADLLDELAAGSKSIGSSSSLPASILEKSRMSLMTLEQRLAGARGRPRRTGAGCASSSVSSSRLVSPITPFIGVRISWLMVARNSDFSREDSSASSRACSNAAAARRRSVMS